jgi:hypothetical protein
VQNDGYVEFFTKMPSKNDPRLRIVFTPPRAERDRFQSQSMIASSRPPVRCVLLKQDRNIAKSHSTLQWTLHPATKRFPPTKPLSLWTPLFRKEGSEAAFTGTDNACATLCFFDYA